jgi:hypothetical protein
MRLFHLFRALAKGSTGSTGVHAQQGVRTIGKESENMNYLKAYICARVRQQDDGILLVDADAVATGEDYWAGARLVTDQPGSMVAVWMTDNLLLPAWKCGPLDVGMALEWVERSLPGFLLVRAEWDEFFQVGARGYTDLVRVGREGAAQS